MPEVCETCPHHKPCASTVWNEATYIRGDEERPLSSVHTCRTCFRKVLTLWASEDAAMVVPDACPRWHPNFGAGTDCGDCLAERGALEEIDPRRAGALVAVGKMLDAIVAQVKTRAEHGPSVVVLDQVRAQNEAVAEVAASTGAAFPILKALQEGDGSYDDAALLMCDLLAFIEGDPVFIAECSHREWNLGDAKVEWIYWLRLVAQKRGSDAAGVARDWMLRFTDHPIGSRTWSRWPISRRKLVLRMWEGVARQALLPMTAPSATP